MITDQITMEECRFMSSMILNRIPPDSKSFCRSSAVAHELLSRIIANEELTLPEAMEITRGMAINGRVSALDEMAATTELITNGFISCDPYTMKVHIDPIILLMARSLIAASPRMQERRSANEQ